MEQRRFGPTRREVPVIGQGTWYSEADERREAVAALRAGLDLGMTHIDTAEMYKSALPSNGSAKRSLVAGMTSSWSRRCCPRMRLGKGRWRRARGPSPGWAPTGLTAISCTGAANTPWRTRSPPSSNWSARARSSPGA